jgi:hypothetical protein
MAPAAVQTKHSVAVKMTCAPAASKQAAMAGPGTPSRSPRTITFLPLNIHTLQRSYLIERSNFKKF